MPELPEVETIKRELAPLVTGRTITGVTLNWMGVVREPSPEEFRQRLAGQKIKELARHGKYLSFRLESGLVLIFHLRMSGSLLLRPPTAPEDKYVRATIQLDSGQELRFRDPRKFGRMWLVADEQSVVGKLGPEPLAEAFTVDMLADRLKNRSAPIKALLCDQEVIAGIGNMYADEALFAAGIPPLKPGGKLTRPEIEHLYQAIRSVLTQAIGDGGASIVDYYRPGGELGIAHFRFKVAHRRKEVCERCGTPIRRITVRNRGTYYCPVCQPESSRLSRHKNKSA